MKTSTWVHAVMGAIITTTSLNASAILPRPVSLLFAEADIVAIVAVTSVVANETHAALYEAKVVTAFKMSTVAETLCFVTHVPHAIQEEYLVFLRNTGDVPATPDARDTEGRPANCDSDRPLYEPLNSGISTALRRECAIRTGLADCEAGYQVDTIDVREHAQVFSQTNAMVIRDATWVRAGELDALLSRMAADAKE